MKPLYLLLTFLLMFSYPVFSQYCGTSGPGECTPSGTFLPGEFTPHDDVPCIYRGQQSSSVSEFTNFDTINFQGVAMSIVTLRIDSIENLPSGLCWSTGKANNTFGNSEAGCIRVSGLTYAPPGQYKLRMTATVNVGIVFQVNASALGINVFLRVIDSSFTFCPPVDTTQTDSIPYIAFNGNYQNVAKVSGQLYFDINQNQTKDAGEQPVRNQLVNVGSYYVALTNGNGEYSAYVTPGVYGVKPALTGNVSSFPFTPDSISVQADSVGLTYSGNDFGIQPPVNFCDGGMAIISTNPPPRPGFKNDMIVRLSNQLSATALAGVVYLSYDSRQSFVSSSPAPDGVDSANHRIFWNVSGINSGSNWQAIAKLYTPQTMALGTVLSYSASAQGLSCSVNTFSADQGVTVVGSYDPNDKAVSPVGEEPGGRVLPNTDFTYTIRFQNTGTYLAENVNIVDTISPHLDLSTLTVQDASHGYEVLIDGRTVTFRFSQIMLADSFSNEPMSHGYIQYKIKPTQTFVQGTVVENLADIYFDFNSPIRTNTTRSTADNFVGIYSGNDESVYFRIYPNPARNSVSIGIDESTLGSTVTITDMTGRMMKENTLSTINYQFSTVDFANGVYFINVNDKEGRSTTKKLAISR